MRRNNSASLVSKASILFENDFCPQKTTEAVCEIRIYFEMKEKTPKNEL